MNLVNAFCEAMLEDPKLWRFPSCDNFRKTVTAIAANPTQYPPGNRLCNRYGQVFDRCILQTWPVERLVLEEIARDCWFVTKDVHEMMNTEKQNIMFGWYATNNVNKVVGANNAWKLPPCLENAIRDHLPNEPGYRTSSLRAQIKGNENEGSYYSLL
jgi:hypothetical protein